MARPFTTISSLLGIAVCGALVWLMATAPHGSAPASQQGSPARPPAAATTTVVPPPPAVSHYPTGQLRVAPSPPPVAPLPVNRLPVDAASATHFSPPSSPPPHLRSSSHDRYPAWAGYPPAPGTSSREYYLACLRQAHRHGSTDADATCQYLANTLRQ